MRAATRCTALLWPVQFINGGDRPRWAHDESFIRGCLGQPVPAKEEVLSTPGKYVCYIDGVLQEEGVGLRFDDLSPVYIDGSVLYPTRLELACGAAAAVQITIDGNGTKSYKIAIIPLDPLYPQESAAAEHLAAQMAVDLGADEAQLTLITDCAAVVSGYTAAVGKQVTCKGVYAGSWLSLENSGSPQGEIPLLS